MEKQHSPAAREARQRPPALLFLSAAAVVLGLGTSTPAFAQSDPLGTEERVCKARGEGQASKPSTAEAFGHCKKGDVIYVGWLLPRGVAYVCDFSKEMLRDKLNETQYCVYIGRDRSEAK